MGQVNIFCQAAGKKKCGGRPEEEYQIILSNSSLRKKSSALYAVQGQDW
jgi:hypothetical protein